MSLILCIETSTNICSVAVVQDGEVVLEKVDNTGPNHAEQLGTFIDEAFCYMEQRDLVPDCVAVSSGPGSYTGLRIGVSMAKGIAYGKNIPLVSVPTLQLQTVAPLLYNDDIPDEALFCSMIDARRMEVYAEVYDRALNVIRPVQPDIVDGETYKELLDKGPVYFLGGGSGKCKEVITHENAYFLDNIEPLAKYMAPLAELRLRRNQTEDVAYFVPFYLKDFVAGKKKATAVKN
ncbi:MAG: tRNA (adenosine(37)-N6)-threonylcarbamoyltransferase complex dimerization subunit type 1 TsaB [Bacteroidaceae bacterium]|nr:tRNA (adenosine(37)-N6)-threonylcarbamoyltransferase complex dimerization subunit type 1 TsaB [Bacteroidaceae bacterium]